jgi:ABC-2 type transport system permease protein
MAEQTRRAAGRRDGVTMQRWRPLVQLFLARLREFYREPEAIFWVYGFPLIMAVGLGIAFWNRKPDPPEVDVQRVSDQAEVAELEKRLRDAGLKVDTHTEEECRQRLRTGKTALYVVPEPGQYRYVYDETRPESLTARYQVDGVVQAWKESRKEWPVEDIKSEEPGSRYIDFLMPGLMGLNMLGGGMWGVGFVIVDMRVRKLLKRLLATPMRRPDFLLSVLGSRLVLMLPEMAVLLLVGCLAFGMPFRGNPFTVALIIFVGAAAFAGIGLLAASRTDKTETVSGLINLVMLPMWLLSGTFFSSKRFPDVVQPLIQALPLTQVNDALREVILEGQSLIDIWWRVAILAAWAGVTFALALRWFRWQ